MSAQKEIQELYVWLAENQPNPPYTEGICTVHVNGRDLPAVASKIKSMVGIQPLIEEEAKRQGITIKLVRFVRQEVVDTIAGETNDPI